MKVLHRTHAVGIDTPECSSLCQRGPSFLQFRLDSLWSKPEFHDALSAVGTVRGQSDFRVAVVASEVAPRGQITGAVEDHGDIAVFTVHHPATRPAAAGDVACPAPAIEQQQDL